MNEMAALCKFMVLLFEHKERQDFSFWRTCIQGLRHSQNPEFPIESEVGTFWIHVSRVTSWLRMRGPAGSSNSLHASCILNPDGGDSRLVAAVHELRFMVYKNRTHTL